MPKTPLRVGPGQYRTYCSRNVPITLIDRLQGVAVLLGTTLEDAVNMALAEGTEIVEARAVLATKDHAKARRSR